MILYHTSDRVITDPDIHIFERDIEWFQYIFNNPY